MFIRLLLPPDSWFIYNLNRSLGYQQHSFRLLLYTGRHLLDYYVQGVIHAIIIEYVYGIISLILNHSQCTYYGNHECIQVPCVYLPGPAPAVTVANSYLGHFVVIFTTFGF